MNGILLEARPARTHKLVQMWIGVCTCNIPEKGTCQEERRKKTSVQTSAIDEISAISEPGLHPPASAEISYGICDFESCSRRVVQIFVNRCSGELGAVNRAQELGLEILQTLSRRPENWVDTKKPGRSVLGT